MEREPEENHDGEDGEQRVETLLDFAGILLDFGLRGGRTVLLGNLGVGQLLLVDHEDHQREEQRHDGHAEGVVEARVEGVEVALGEGTHVGRGAVEAHLGGQFAEAAVNHLGSHRAAQILVAEGRKVRVVEVALRAQPPVADAHGRKGGDHGADVDEHVENLEARIAQLGVLLVVVELAHQCLEVALEEAVAEGDNHQGADDHRFRGDGGYHQHGVTQRHDHDAGDNRPLVVAQAVGDESAHQSEDVNRGVEERIDFSGLLTVDAEFRHEEERQDGHHRVEAEAFAGVGQRGGNQAFGLIFEHCI